MALFSFYAKSFQILLQQPIDKKRKLRKSSLSLLSLVCVIKDRGKGFYNGKSIELYITIWKLYTQRHTKPFSNLRRWSWVGSCVLQRLMKASHLKDRSEDGARSECFQRDSNDLCELKHQRSLPPFNLPLLSTSTWLSSEWERKETEEGASCFSSVLSYTLGFSSGYLVQPNRCARWSCHHRRMDAKTQKRM